MSIAPEQKFLHSLPEESLYTILHPDSVYTVHSPDDELDLMHGTAFDADGTVLAHQVEKAGKQFALTDN